MAQKNTNQYFEFYLNESGSVYFQNINKETELRKAIDMQTEAARNIQTNISARVKDYNSELIKDATDVYKYIYIGDSKTSLADNINATLIEHEGENVNTVANCLIAEALTKGKSIRCIPDNNNQKNVTTYSTKFFANNRPIKLNLFDIILSRIGFETKNYKLYKKLEVVNNAIASKRNEVYEKANNKIKKQKPSKQEIIADNKAFIPEIVEKLRNFANQKDIQFKALSKQGLSGVSESDFKKSDTKEPSNLYESEVFISRSWPTLVTCMMLKDNHILENILDPDYNPDAKTKAGAEAARLVKECADKTNPQAQAAAKKKLLDVYVEGAKKILNIKMPDKKELEGFLEVKDSKRAGYLSAIPYISFDLTQEFKRVDENFSNNPQNRALCSVLDAVSKSAGFCSISEAVIYRMQNIEPEAKEQFRKTAEESNVQRAMSNIALQNIEKGLNFEQADTVGDYMAKNYSKVLSLDAYRSSVSLMYPVLYGNESENPTNFRDLYEHKVAASKEGIAEFYSTALETVKSSNKEYGGDFGKVFARADLAADVVSHMTSNEGKEFSKEQQDKLAVELMSNDAFLNATDVELDMIKSYIGDPTFFSKNLLGKFISEKKGQEMNKNQKPVKEKVTEKKNDGMSL